MRWKFVVLVLTLVLILLGSVNADVNLALTGTPSFVNSAGGDNTCGGCPYGVGWQTNALYLNNNNINNPVGVCISTYLGTYSGTYTAIIDLDNTNNQINNVEYVAWGYAYGQSGTMLTSLYYNGGWNDIDSRSINIGGGPSPNPQTVTIPGGPWYDVEKIRIYTTLQAQLNYCVQNYIYEIRTIGTFCGDGSCNGDEDCGDCIADCGTCCTPDCAGKECGNDGCGGSCGDCDILYPGEGRVCNAAGACVPSTAGITDASWTSMNSSEEIFQADLYDRVRLMVEGTELTGETINYTIEKYETFWWLFRYWNEIARFSDLGYSTWKANETGTYRFNASIIGDSAMSNNLIVSASQDNTPPVAEILAPGICEIYFTGETISFTQNSYDVDDSISVKWDFGDDVTSTEYDTTHIYITGGQKTIILTVTDERGLTATDRTTILVVDSSVSDKYVCAYINEPEWGASKPGYDIFFNATDTYAINASNCDGTSCSNIECIAGPCKTQTIGGGGIPVTGANPNWIGFANINFSWSFDDNATYKASGMSGAWFNKTFGYPGEHWAKLTASINPEGSIETNFNIINKTSQKEIEKSKEDTLISSKDLMLVLIILLIITIIYFRLSKKRRKKKKL